MRRIESGSEEDARGRRERGSEKDGEKEREVVRRIERKEGKKMTQRKE